MQVLICVCFFVVSCELQVGVLSHSPVEPDKTGILDSPLSRLNIRPDFRCFCGIRIVCGYLFHSSIEKKCVIYRS